MRFERCQRHGLDTIPPRPQTSDLETENLMAAERPTPKLPAPDILNKWPVLFGLVLLLLVPFFLPIPLSLRRHPLIGNIGDQVHVPFLMGLTLLMYWRGPLTGRLKSVIFTAMLLGGAIELVQTLVGRAALLADFFLDLAGIFLAVGLIIWKGYQRKSGLGLMFSIVLILSAQLYYLPGLILGSYHSKKSFPIISDFEGPHEKWLWHPTYQAQLDIQDIQDSPSGQSKVMRLESGPPSRWPGAQMVHFSHDWSSYKTLRFDARHITPNRELVPFSIRLDDFHSRRDQTWVSNSFKATTEWISYSLSVVDRKVIHGDRILDMTEISHLLIFLSDKKDSTIIQIDNLRLE